MTFLRGFTWSILIAVAFTGCVLIDENTGDCETDYHLNYELRLVTDMTTELETQVSTQVELTSVADALKEHLKGIFTDFAHDVDLSFYDVLEDPIRLHHETHIMDDNQHSYTLYIPVHEYMHIAVANIQSSEVILTQDDRCNTARLEHPVNDVDNIIKSQSTGLFTARLPMDIKGGVDQTFNVKLYMANCASALTLDTLDSHIKDFKVYASGFANGFELADSTYYFQFTPQVKSDEVKVDDGRFICYCNVNFPSKDVVLPKSIIDTDDPYVSPVADEALWKYTIYATLQDGTVTETILGVKLPLRPGQFKLIRGKVEPDGSVVPREPYVGASVTLQWNDGVSWDVDC